MQLINLVAHSSEFENIMVREEEQHELEMLRHGACPLEVRSGPEDKTGKINILIQVAYYQSTPLVSSVCLLCLHACYENIICALPLLVSRDEQGFSLGVAIKMFQGYMIRYEQVDPTVEQMGSKCFLEHLLAVCMCVLNEHSLYFVFSLDVGRNSFACTVH